MRYKTLALQKLDALEGTRQQIDTAISHNDKEKALGYTEMLQEQLNEFRSMLSIEPDDFEQQF